MIRAYGPALALIGLAALVPFAVSANTVLNFIVFALIIALAAQGWNLLGGLAGQFSFGHAAFSAPAPMPPRCSRPATASMHGSPSLSASCSRRRSVG